jgi:hypothetical protein
MFFSDSVLTVLSIFRTVIITGNTGPVLQAYASISCIMVTAAAEQKATPPPPVTLGRRAVAADVQTA